MLPGRHAAPGAGRRHTGRTVHTRDRWNCCHYHRVILSPTHCLVLQVNYFKDHTKLIVAGAGAGPGQGLVTYINTDRAARTWSLAELARRGATTQVKERLSYVASVLEEFAELDEQASS